MFSLDWPSPDIFEAYFLLVVETALRDIRMSYNINSSAPDNDLP